MLKTGKLCYLKFGDKLQEVNVGVVDEMEGLTDDAMYGLLGGLQEAVQPNLHASLSPHRPLKVHHLALHCDRYSTRHCFCHRDRYIRTNGVVKILFGREGAAGTFPQEQSSIL